MTDTRLIPETVQAINDAHDECSSYDAEIGAILVRKANAARRAGVNLEGFFTELKKKPILDENGRKVPVKNLFESGASACIFRFSLSTAHNYTRFAEAHPGEWTEGDIPKLCKTLYALMVYSGAIQVGGGGHGDQKKSGLTWFNKFTLKAQSMFGLINDWKAKEGDIEKWTPVVRSETKASLEPFVQLYNRL